MYARFALIACLSMVLIALTACSAAGDGQTNQKKPTAASAETVTPAKTPKIEAKAPPAATAATAQKKTAAPSFAEAPYKIRFVTKPATKGEESATTIEITPLAGYKMNKDFPTSLKVNASPSAATPKLDYATGDAEITEERVGFRVGYTPNKAGALAMTGTTNFSVCNERTCKLFRGEKLAWEVSVK